MMQLRRNLVLGVFLVLQWKLVRSDSVQDPVHRLPCIYNETTVTCRLAKGGIPGIQTIMLNVSAEGTKTYLTALENSSAGIFTPCFWTQRGTARMLLFQLFTRGMDGVYHAVCGNSNYSVDISVHINSPGKRPSIPQLSVTVEKYTPSIRCVSNGIPKPTITWYSNSEVIWQTFKKDTSTEKDTTMSILNGFEYQSSNTKCCAKNSHGEECALIYHYDLNKDIKETEAPRILLYPGQILNLRCKVKTKNDSLRVNWYFNNTELSGARAIYFNDFIEYFSIKSVSVQDSGEYVCKSEDNQKKSTQVLVHEKYLLNILELNENVQIPQKEKARFCFQARVLSNPKAQCHWILPNGTKVQCNETQYLWSISVFKLCDPEPGQYQIQLRAGEMLVKKNVSLCVTETPKFTILQDLTQVTCMTNSLHPMEVFWQICPMYANCTDSAKWEKRLVALQDFPNSGQFCHKKIVISKAYSVLNVNFVQCCLTNQNNTYCSDRFPVKITFPHTKALTGICSTLVIALLLVSIILVYFICKKKPGYETQLQIIQVVGPSDNDYIYIDFRDFKYDQRWEFPRENLELGKELGSGAFGMVVQATAYGISKPGESMQVAVKMLKDKHEAVEKEALMSELKMLTHIGHHTNIVNLLGACTGTGPIYLIFQFCCHGDLLNYLKINRENFHKSLADALNKDRFSGLYQNFQRKRNCSVFAQSDDLSYMHMSPVWKEHEALLSTTSTDVSEEIFVSEDEDLQTLTYDDLLSFSYQVAKGMEFLSSKNCIHRDLAARNILVTQGRLVKIGDFGLARDVENDSNYVVRGNARLPVKWMAPESIFKGMYTMQSDVWAYGILLWEIFSLGVTPYPGIKVNNTFYAMIERGFHMESPYYASESIYQMMCRCWALEPMNRPCFSKLVTFMEYQLSDFEEQLYHNVGGQQNSDSTYKNTPVTLDLAETVEEQDTCQSTPTDSSCKADTTKEYTDKQDERERGTYL